VGLILGSVGALMLLTYGIDVALRPKLGPDVEEPEAQPAIMLRQVLFLDGANACGHDDDEHEYDVNRALLSDEPMDGIVEPEGTGPARRRYVRPDPRDFLVVGNIPGTTTLVRNSLVREQPRRHPALPRL
jgi:hypothetical protein